MHVLQRHAQAHANTVPCLAFIFREASKQVGTLRYGATYYAIVAEATSMVRVVFCCGSIEGARGQQAVACRQPTSQIR